METDTEQRNENKTEQKINKILKQTNIQSQQKKRNACENNTFPYLNCEQYIAKGQQ